MASKPSGGRCPKCGHKGLLFKDDGSGQCPGCKKTFTWRKKGAPRKPKGGLCGECGHKGLTFNDDGSGSCPKCGYQFNWVKKLQEKEKGGVRVLSAVNYAKAHVVYKLKIENNGTDPIGEVHIKPFISNDIFMIDENERSIPLIKPGEAKTATFNLRPRKECGNVEVHGRVTYYDYKKKDYVEAKAKPRTTQVICPMMRIIEVTEEEWRGVVKNMVKIEETTDDIPINAEALFDIVTDVVKDMNMFMLPEQKTESGDVLRGVARFYCEGVKGLKYATQVEVIGADTSKMFIKAWAENEQSLLGFYVCLLDEIEDRTAVKKYISDDLVALDGVRAAEAHAGGAAAAAPVQVAKDRTVLQKGFSYLIYEEKSDKTFQLFEHLTKGGIPGLIITTIFPDKIRNGYGLEDAHIYWLTETRLEGTEALQPKRLDFEMQRSIMSFMKNNKESAILLEGIEYLILENGFDKVIKFLKHVNDNASAFKATIVVPINPRSIDEKELNILKREFDKAG